MSQRLIEYYKAIEDSSVEMLEAAKVEDWDGVARIEGACALLIEQLCLRARMEELTPEIRAEKSRIMLRILRNDAQIRHFTEPWLDHFEQQMQDKPQYFH